MTMKVMTTTMVTKMGHRQRTVAFIQVYSKTGDAVYELICRHGNEDDDDILFSDPVILVHDTSLCKRCMIMTTRTGNAVTCRAAIFPTLVTMVTTGRTLKVTNTVDWF